MKLMRYGAKGAEKPGLVDAQGRVRALSGVVADIDAAALSPAGLARLRAVDIASLPVVEQPGRIRVTLRSGQEQTIALTAPAKIMKLDRANQIAVLQGPEGKTITVDVENPEKSQIFSKCPKFVKDHHAMDFVCDSLRMAVTLPVTAQSPKLTTTRVRARILWTISR